MRSGERIRSGQVGKEGLCEGVGRSMLEGEVPRVRCGVADAQAAPVEGHGRGEWLVREGLEGVRCFSGGWAGARGGVVLQVSRFPKRGVRGERRGERPEGAGRTENQGGRKGIDGETAPNHRARLG
jgi:hypothetical protein